MVSQLAEAEAVVEHGVQCLMHQQERGQSGRLWLAGQLGKASRIKEQALAVGRAVRCRVSPLPVKREQLAVGQWPVLGCQAHGALQHRIGGQLGRVNQLCLHLFKRV